MAATRLDIIIEQGSTFAMNVQALNEDRSIMNLTGYDARLQVRPTVGSSTILLSASTSDGRITINAPGGMVMVRIGADTTAALTFNDATYDLEAYKSADVTEVRRLVEGSVTLSLEVTRP
jgi:hypothetical protein